MVSHGLNVKRARQNTAVPRAMAIKKITDEGCIRTYRSLREAAILAKVLKVPAFDLINF